jgi:hypothetical protein
MSQEEFDLVSEFTQRLVYIPHGVVVALKLWDDIAVTHVFPDDHPPDWVDAAAMAYMAGQGLDDDRDEWSPPAVSQ